MVKRMTMVNKALGNREGGSREKGTGPLPQVHVVPGRDFISSVSNIYIQFINHVNTYWMSDQL